MMDRVPPLYYLENSQDIYADILYGDPPKFHFSIPSKGMTELVRWMLTHNGLARPGAKAVLKVTIQKNGGCHVHFANISMGYRESMVTSKMVLLSAQSKRNCLILFAKYSLMPSPKLFSSNNLLHITQSHSTLTLTLKTQPTNIHTQTTNNTCIIPTMNKTASSASYSSSPPSLSSTEKKIDQTKKFPPPPPPALLLFLSLTCMR